MMKAGQAEPVLQFTAPLGVISSAAAVQVLDAATSS